MRNINLFLLVSLTTNCTVWATSIGVSGANGGGGFGAFEDPSISASESLSSSDDMTTF